MNLIEIHTQKYNLYFLPFAGLSVLIHVNLTCDTDNTLLISQYCVTLYWSLIRKKKIDN